MDKNGGKFTANPLAQGQIADGLFHDVCQIQQIDQDSQSLFKNGIWNIVNFGMKNKGFLHRQIPIQMRFLPKEHPDLLVHRLAVLLGIEPVDADLALVRIEDPCQHFNGG